MAIQTFFSASRSLLLAVGLIALAGTASHAQTDPMPSWNNGPTMAAIERFEKATTDSDRAAISKLSERDIFTLVAATHAGITVDPFRDEVRSWIGKARDSHFGRHYTELTYKPMLEAMAYLRANGFTVYIVTGGEQDFVRAFADQTYQVPPGHVIGTMLDSAFAAHSSGKSAIRKVPKVMRGNDGPGKPQGIHLAGVRLQGVRCRPA